MARRCDRVVAELQAFEVALSKINNLCEPQTQLRIEENGASRRQTARDKKINTEN
jgi:hypothetical protein